MPEAGGTKEKFGLRRARDLIFVSYSHADTQLLEDFLRVGKPYFTANRLTVWCDHKIRTGYKWLPAVEDALARTRLAVLLISQHFFESPFIQENELPAILAAAEEDACSVIPIHISASGYRQTKVACFQFPHDPARPLDIILPKARRNPVWVQIWDKLKAEAEPVWGRDFDQVAPIAAAPSASVTPIVAADHRGALHGVPDYKPYFLARDELEPLVAALLGSTTGAIGLTGAPIGLHGMGGIGKTELAVALCHDDRVRRAFPDGLYWLTLGQSPDPHFLLSDLAALAGDAAPHFASVVQAQEALRLRFRDRAALLVIDDLWRLEDARDLAILGPRSRMLITTRDAGLLTALGAGEVSLGVLGWDLALRLLATWSKEPEPLPDAAHNVAEECGRLPLALALAGARVRDGASWETVRAALAAGNLEFLDHPHGSVLKALRMSVAALSPNDAGRYGELAVFPEDVRVPVETIERLWAHTGSLAPLQTGRLLDDLARKGLLSRTTDQDRQPTIGFHDLQQDFLKLDADDPPALHIRLLDAHRPATGAWADLPADEPYPWTWLAWHLAEAGRDEELKALLLHPAWLKAKLLARDVNALISDYDQLPGDADARLVRQALTMSAHVLANDKRQLAGQLIGRLNGSIRPAIAELSNALQGRSHDGGTLIPQSRSLLPADGSLLRTYARPQEGGWPTSSRSKVSFSFLAVLPDLRRFVSLDSHCTLRLWDIATGAVIATPAGFAGEVSAATLFADGRAILFGTREGRLVEWRLEGEGSARVVVTNAGYVQAIAAQPDGLRAISGDRKGTIAFWDLRAGTRIAEYTDAEENRITGLAVAQHPQGYRALSAALASLTKLWDMEHCRLIRSFDEIHGVKAFTSDGRTVTGSVWTGLVSWDVWNSRIAPRLPSYHPPGFAVPLAIQPDGRHVLLPSILEGKPTLQVWELEKDKAVRTLGAHQDEVTALAIAPDGCRALSGSRDGTIKLWDLTEADERPNAGHRAKIAAITLLPDRRHAISASHDQSLKVRDLETRQVIHTLSGHQDEVRDVALLPDGTAVSGSHDGELILWDVGKGSPINRFKSGVSHLIAVVAVPSPDGVRVLSASAWGDLVLVDIATRQMKKLRRLDPDDLEHQTLSLRLTALPSGREAISLSKCPAEKLVKWNLNSGEGHQLTCSGRLTGRVEGTVSPDGRLVFFTSTFYDRETHVFGPTFVLWDLSNDRLIREFSRLQENVTAVAVLPDCGFAVSGAGDGSVIAWDVSKGVPLGTFTADAEISALACVSPSLFIAGDEGGGVHVLKLVE